MKTGQNSKFILTINIALVVAAGAVFTYLNRNFIFDDALIYYRYIENFLNGNGLVYNKGERFNALTSPLYIYISLLVSLITGEVTLTQTVLSGSFLVLSSIMIILIFREIGMEKAGLIASIAIVSAKYFYQVFGMETNLFIFLSLTCIYFYLKNNIALLSAAGALLLLARGEGIFLLGILLYFIYKEKKIRLRLKYLLPFAVIIGGNILFYYLYYGQAIPHTFAAKVSQGSSGLWGRYSFITGIEYLLGMFNKQGFYIVILFFAAAVGLIKFHSNKVLKILIIDSILLIIFYASLNIPNYHWYYSVMFLTLFLLSSFGVCFLSEYITFRSVKKSIISLVIILVFIYTGITHLEIVQLNKNEKPNQNYRYIGEWLRNNTPESSKIAAVEVGHLGWYSKRYIIDILGLTNPHNAEYIGRREFSKWFEIYKPDYILMHVPVWAHEQSIPDLVERGYFSEDPAFSLPGYKLYKSTGKIQ